MKYRFLLLGFFLVLSATTGYAQTADAYVNGRIVSIVAGEKSGVFGAQVELLKNGTDSKARGLTDGEGAYRLGPVEAGTYTLKIQSMEIPGGVKLIPNITLGGDQTRALPDIAVSGETETIVVRRKVTDKTTNKKELTQKEIQRSTVRGVNDLIGSTGAATVIDGKVYSKAGRDNSNAYYVNGIRMNSAPNLPRSAIEELSIITGGVPAEYGDVLGAVTTITTRGPSKIFAGGLELVNSKFIDPYGYKLIEGNLTGPLVLKKKGQDSGEALIGFFLAGNISHIDVSDPPAIDVYRVKDSKLEELKNDPITQSPFGDEGFISRTSFVKMEDMERTRIRPNTQTLSYAISGSLDFQLGNGVVLTAGGTKDYIDRNDYVASYSMYNFENNPQRIEGNNRAFFRFRQIFNTDTASVVKNAYYSIQGDYSRFDRVIQDETHKDNYWDYGYLGKFERFRKGNYKTETRRIGDKDVKTNYLTGYGEDGVTFTPGGKNTVTENYTTRFFDLTEEAPQSYSQVTLGGGLLNGMNPGLVYSLWANPGNSYGSYQKTTTEQIAVNASAAAEIKMGKTKKNTIYHQFKVGLQFEQRTSRQWVLGTTGGGDIWNLGRQLTNFHLTQLDTAHPIPVYDDQGNFMDTINYNFLIDPTTQKTFDKNFRQYLIDKGARDENGRPITDQSLINIDYYDPSEYRIGWFSPDELMSNGAVSYFGYDHAGNEVKGRTSLADFLDPNKRSVGAYTPIYVAGYIQDKFQFRDDVMMRIGLRVDRFDANQPVLRDPYSLYPVKTAGEVSEINGQPISHPGNIGTDYKVYVDDAMDPTRIVGYRKDNVWYDATGAELQDPSVLVTETQDASKIQPYLVNEENRPTEAEMRLTESSFKDYEAQVSIMPRIAFSFPISEKSQFYANYDVLTQRPRVGNIGGLDDYYYLDKRSTIIIANPDLKPEKRINYEVGFRQSVGKSTDVTIEAFYGEVRDMVQLTTYNNAYPVTYSTLGNIDFGTIKGLRFDYDFSGQGNSGLAFNVNYTLQFAKGTGSTETAAQGLINAGLPNLRNPIPLDYDSRHQFAGSFDYRLGSGKDYLGPRGAKNGWEKIFQDMGVNMVFYARSGTPYTRQVNVTSGGGILLGIAQRSSIAGEINGSRLPWQFRSDMRIDKDFFLRGKDLEGKKTRRVADMTIYLQVNNVFNSLNVINVYRYTGLPDDDGYLQSPEGQAFVKEHPDQQSFVDQYNVKMVNPDNYIQPRYLRLGATINF